MQLRLSYRVARQIAIERDGARCLICGTSQDLTVHHRLPRRVVKLHLPCNLLTVCRRCHSAVEQLDQLTQDLAWWTEYHCAAAQIRADMQRGASIVERAQQLLRQGGCHGWSHALDVARQELTFNNPGQAQLCPFDREVAS